MTPAEAMQFHSEQFIDDFSTMANASKNPTLNQVYYLHNSWRNANLGTLTNPFEKLKEKMKFYEMKGNTESLMFYLYLIKVLIICHETEMGKAHKLSFKIFIEVILRK